MKKIVLRVKEIENPENKNEVYASLYAILDDLASYSGCIYDSLIDCTYRVPASIEVEDDHYIPYLKKIIRENDCSDLDSLLETLSIIKQRVVEKGINENEFDYDVEETMINSLIISIAVFA
ncbi:MAG: hypothetical protein IJ086_15990 [Clostridium sp.]|nr:hypothetical protein [Clostridium sp.]MBQ9000176.1 hypothetical protein [Clostridium sp.]